MTTRAARIKKSNFFKQNMRKGQPLHYDAPVIVPEYLEWLQGDNYPESHHLWHSGVNDVNRDDRLAVPVMRSEHIELHGTGYTKFCMKHNRNLIQECHESWLAWNWQNGTSEIFAPQWKIDKIRSR